LVGVDDDVLCILRWLSKEGLCDCQGRAAIAEADLDHHACGLRYQEVAKNVTVPARNRHPIEVAIGPGVFWADLSEPVPRLAYGHQKLQLTWHH
jgi:hypothetical protein